MKTSYLERCLGLIAIPLIFLSCSRSAYTSEPVYNGRPLSYWAGMTQDESPDRSPSPEAQEAIAAVKAIGPAKAVPFLVRWIRPPWKDSTIPGGAVECFKIFGPEAKAAVPDLAKILKTPPKTLDDLSAQTEAAEALSYLGPDAVPVLLTAATNSQGQHVQWEIIDDMANFGSNGAPAIPALLKWSQDSDSWVRLGALHAYVAIETNKPATIRFLLKALNDPDGLMRRDAAEFLGDVAHGQKEMLPALLKALSDPDWQVQTGAIEGLGNLGVERAVVLPLLVQKLNDENPVIRRVAAFALGDLGGKEAFDALLKSTDDPDGFVREAVFQSLKKIDPQALARSGKKFY